MINRATGGIDFRTGLHIRPHCPVASLNSGRTVPQMLKSQRLPMEDWTRHVLGCHDSEFGTFEVEALSADEGRVHLVLLAHKHAFYDPRTPDDAERRVFHEGVISSDLAGQREFTWGDVLCRLESAANKDWLVIAYRREASVPLRMEDVIRRLTAHEDLPGEGV